MAVALLRFCLLVRIYSSLAPSSSRYEHFHRYRVDGIARLGFALRFQLLDLSTNVKVRAYRTSDLLTRFTPRHL